MQFKDDLLKTLREIEKKIMVKVSKSQADISTDINIINEAIKLLKENNNSIIDSIAEQKVNIDKISDFEKTLKKMGSTVSGHENKISDSISEISYIRNRCEKSMTETFSVPGIIGKNCKFSNFNEYIMYNLKEITALKSEKDYNRKENKDLRTRLDQGLKNLSNLVDTFINRSKLYTDSNKKIILELLDSKINEVEDKNMEFMTKLCKIDIDTEKKIKDIEDNMEDFSKKKNEQFQKMDDKLLLINYNVEEMTKNLEKAKEELNLLKKNEKQYQNDITELKTIIKNILNNNNNSSYNYNQNFYQNINNPNNNNIKENYNLFPFSLSSKSLSINKYYDTNSFNEFNKNNFNIEKYSQNSKNIKISKKSKVSQLLEDLNYYNTKKNNNMNNQINSNSIINNSNTNNQKNINKELNIDLKDINEESLLLSEQMSQTDDKNERKKENIKEDKDKDKGLNDNNFAKTFNARTKRKNTIDPKNIFNKNKKFFSFDTNTILEENSNRNIVNKKRENYFHKTIKENKSTKDNDLLLTNKIKKGTKEIKNEKLKNKDLIKEIKEEEPLILNQKIKTGKYFKSTNYNNINIKKSHIPFPLIKSYKMTFSHDNINKINNKINNIHNLYTINNNNNSYIYKKNEKIRNKNDINKNKQFDIDQETGTGYKVVKLSFDETMTPYNTNGLLAIASKKYLNKELIFMDESTPYDDIYSMKNMNMFNTFNASRNSNSSPKRNNKNNHSNKTTQIFLNNNSFKKKIKENLELKTINPGDAFNYGKVRFHLIKKKK